MKHRLYFAIAMLLLASIVLGACAAPAAPAPAAPAATTAPAAPAEPTAAPAPEKPAGKPLFVAINKSADQQYFIDLQNSFVATAGELGADAKKFDAKLDPNLGVSLVNDAISAGAKGIAITVPDQTIGPAIAKAAKDAGVVLIATDDGIKDEAGNPVPFVGFDGKDMGKKVGEAAAKLLTDSGWLKDAAKKVGVLSVEVQTLSVCVDRTDNEKAALKAAGVTDAQIFPVVYTGETLSSQDAAGPVITAHPEITNWVVTSCNDEGVLGALNALATAGVKTDDVIGVGLGSYEACKPWAAGQPSGFKAGLFISGLDVGKTAATVLNDAVVNGKTPPASFVRPDLHRGSDQLQDRHGCDLAGELLGRWRPCPRRGRQAAVRGDQQERRSAVLHRPAELVRRRPPTSLGADAKKFDAKLDPNLGVSLVNDAISAGAKGIAITVPGSDHRAGDRQGGQGCGRGPDCDRRQHQGRGRQPGPVRRLRRQGHGQEGRRGRGQAAHRQRLAEGLPPRRSACSPWKSRPFRSATTAPTMRRRRSRPRA